MSTPDTNSPSTLERDPVCGMNVNPATAKNVYAHDDKNHYFCGAGCAEKFKTDPERYLAPERHRSNTAASSGPALPTTPIAIVPHPTPPSPDKLEKPAAYVCAMCP